MPDKGDLREVAGAVRKGPVWQRGKRKQDSVPVYVIYGLLILNTCNFGS